MDGGGALAAMRLFSEWDADASYLRLRRGRIVRTEGIDDHRLRHLNHDGQTVGIEFLEVSGGVDLSTLALTRAQRRAARELFGAQGIPVRGLELAPCVLAPPGGR